MNNQTTPIQSTLLLNKLSALVSKIQNDSQTFNIKEYQTLEKTINQAFSLLSKFYKTLSLPSFEPIKVFPESIPDPSDYNNNFNMILEDLTTIFREFENLEGVVIGNFNYTTSRLNRLNAKLKKAYSNLGDFVLYSQNSTKDAIYFADSFNNLNKIEINTPLLTKKQATINQEEGIITLPIETKENEKALEIKELPVVNSNSNGIYGNNEEKGKSINNDLSVILDNNADTWFEYERVVSKEDNIPLILDMTLNLGDPKIVNYIRVNPNNFGTRTQIEILTIETSIDGKVFYNIKDELPIGDFISADEENIFILSPSTSKFAGQGIYTFSPRKTKFIHLTFKQSTSYPIITNNNKTKYRYAIGIRDIEVKALTYATEGEMISTLFETYDEVKKVAIYSNQNPIASTSSSLASIQHFISPDNGLSWFQIRPLDNDGNADKEQELKEILDFNGVNLDTINTNNSVLNLRYKALLKRNSAAFVSDNADLAKELATNTELHTAPTTSPFALTLEKKPIKNSISIIDPQYGSRGFLDLKYKIAQGTGVEIQFRLPFGNIKKDYLKTWDGSKWTLGYSNPEKIYLNGIQWTNGELGSTDRTYRINYQDGIIKFGDGTNGAAPPNGAIIEMALTEEQIFPIAGDTHIANLVYPTSNDKKQVEISIRSPLTTRSFLLKKGETIHKLPDRDIERTYPACLISDTTLFPLNNFVTFVDGNTEFTSNKNWTVDFDNSILYLKVPVNSTSDTTISYRCYPREILEETDWDFINSDNTIQSLQIYDSKYKTNRVIGEKIPLNIKYFNLSKLGIAKGSIVFKNQDGDIPESLIKEVEYIDGYTELVDVVKTKQKIPAITGVSGATNKTFSLTMTINSSPNYNVSFSDTTIFSNEETIAGNVDTVGDYHIDRTTGLVTFRVDDNYEDPGTIEYYYTNPQSQLTGKYSVNYDTGEIFCYTLTGAGTPNDNLITVDFKYTDYRIKYNVARQVSKDDWEYNAEENKIFIKDREILKNSNILAISQNNFSSKYYRISYNYFTSTRDDIKELEPYFTPILKDYIIKVITKSRLS